MKVALIGAAGGIGQPLALLLKQSHLITELALYDLVNTPGIACDLSHVNTASKVSGYLGDTKNPEKDQLPQTLQGAQVVVITAGVARKPGMSRDDLFKINAGIIHNIASGIAQHCPKAMVLVITNPVNSTVPIVAEVLSAKGVFDPKRLFGVTTLDVVRSSRFIADILPSVNPAELRVNVVGGHSGGTIVPLLSQTPVFSQLNEEQIKALTNRIQFGGDEVVKAKDGAGSATLSMAYAGARFALAVVRALNGETGIVEPSFVKSDLYEKSNGIPFFSSNVELGRNGVEKIHPVGTSSDYEKSLLETCLKDLKGNVDKGVSFAKEKAGH
ncbi:hypothetical protein MP228_003144 [Amoeboaphelidium protococcarum]|nr:hypothetical protein MP228_003144 [Amoeboaphelidium protococcarum]